LWPVKEEPTPDLLLVGLVLADGLAAVKVRVDAGIHLVHHVALVGACGVVGGAGAGVDGATTVTVRVDAGVSGVGYAAAVGAVSAGGSAVGAGHTSHTGASVGVVGVGRAEAGGAGAGRVKAGRAGMGASVAHARAHASAADGLAAVAVRVDAGVGSISDARRVRSVGALSGAVRVGAQGVGMGAGGGGVRVGGEGVGAPILAVASDAASAGMCPGGAGEA